MEKDTKRFHAIIKGFVQGVGFRFFVFQYGVNLNLNGWVRNRYNGDVEVLVEGPEDVLRVFLEKLHQGPQMAHVDEVELDWQEPAGDLPTFTIHESQ
jgi:acylphosphatase